MSLTVDTSEFQRWNQKHLANTKRNLHDAANRRMFYVLLRAYAILPPKDPQAERNKIRDYMNQQIGERTRVTATGKVKRLGRARQLQRRHLIAQARNRKEGKPGLYGQKMKDAAAALVRRAVGSVGYLKSPLVKAMRHLVGGFTQFGGRTKKSGGKDIPANHALLSIAKDYGLAGGNVAMHKGAIGRVKLAVPGLNPTVQVRLSVGVDNMQFGRAMGFYNSAFAQAFRDETEAIKRHLAETVQDAADQADKR